MVILCLVALGRCGQVAQKEIRVGSRLCLGYALARPVRGTGLD